MVSGKPRRKSSAVQTPNQAREKGPGRTSRSGRAADDAKQHSEKGATPTKTTLKRYLIVIEKSNGNYGAHAPDLLGCGALADTIEETIANLKKAIEMHAKAMNEDGDEIPEPSTIGDYIEIPEPRKAKTA